MSARLGTLLLALAAALALYAMQRTTPRYMALTGPITANGTMGQTVSARQFEVTVERVQFAQQLNYKSLSATQTRTTGGVWAIVWLRLAARDASASAGEAAWLGPDGLAYRHTDRLVLARNQPPHAVEPGLPRSVRLVFEIRPDQARGATLLLSARYGPRLDSQVRIALDEVPVDDSGRPVAAAQYDLDQEAAP
ncbi:hypothetical protein FOC84_27110 [Achromobacter pestifer]|uniref:DUF4352 domain-containing protein n=1 Tax=Achromobacter pestifer TaxID=1353889 RepID=A0A7D4E1Q8_9BURK|nr:hypothetical protein [Achromobacter pestifer]QKH38407.1 hypothetical protein FOC84_27110 [Achromobacter pestifer]